MVALGLLLILSAAVIGTGAVLDGGEKVTFELLGVTIDNVSVGAVFLAGAATMLLGVLGLWIMMKALARGRRKRSERKEATTAQRDSVSEIERERAELRAENERLSERLTRESRPASSGGQSADDRPVSPEETTVIQRDQTDLTANDQTSSTSGHRRDGV